MNEDLVQRAAAEKSSGDTVKAFADWQRSLHITSDTHYNRIELQQAFIVAISKQAALAIAAQEGK